MSFLNAKSILLASLGGALLSDGVVEVLMNHMKITKYKINKGKLLRGDLTFLVLLILSQK